MLRQFKSSCHSIFVILSVSEFNVYLKKNEVTGISCEDQFPIKAIFSKLENVKSKTDFGVFFILMKSFKIALFSILQELSNTTTGDSRAIPLVPPNIGTRNILLLPAKKFGKCSIFFTSLKTLDFISLSKKSSTL